MTVSRRRIRSSDTAWYLANLALSSRGGSGPGVPSLAVVRPAAPPSLVITPRDPAQVNEWQRRAEAMAGRRSLFDDPAQTKSRFEIVPWRFRYHYRCPTPGCNGHEQTIVDWEVVALWRRLRHHPSAAPAGRRASPATAASAKNCASSSATAACHPKCLARARLPGSPNGGSEEPEADVAGDGGGHDAGAVDQRRVEQRRHVRRRRRGPDAGAARSRTRRPHRHGDGPAVGAERQR